jgi:hypothetical protein
VRVAAARQRLARGKAGDIGEHELVREGEKLVQDPADVLFRAVLEDVGADHAIEGAAGQRRERLVARVEAADFLHAPIGADVGMIDLRLRIDHAAQRVLLALAGAVIEDRMAARTLDPALDVRGLLGQALPGEHELGRDAEALVAVLVHELILLDEAPIPRARRRAAVAPLH